MQLNSVGTSTVARGQNNGSARGQGTGNSLLTRLLGPPQQLMGGSGRQGGAQGGSQDRGGPRGVAAQAAQAVSTVLQTAQQSTATAVERPSQQEQEGAVQNGPVDLGFPRTLADDYDLGPVLGKGGNGVVRVAKDRATGVEYACKSIPKVLKAGPNVTEKKKANHIASMKQEIAVLKKLKGSLNIIDLEGVYEDDESVHLVMECCNGGELSFAIAQRHYSERTVASFMRAVLRTLAQCHAQNILHRDVKPGNFMLLSADERAPLRAIDFGLAMPYEPQDLPLTNLGLEGTPWFQAPEVLSSRVSPASDLWSAGVMAYQLLTGRLPFDDHRNPMNPSITAIWRSVLTDKPDFKSSVWDGISAEAKDFVAKLLERDPAKRPTAREALKHPWLVGDSRERSTGKQLQQSVVARIQRFAAVSNFKRTVLEMIASEMLQHPTLAPAEPMCVMDRGRAVVPDPAAECLQPLYTRLKFDSNDEADASQVHAALRDLGFTLSQAEVDRLLQQLDPASTGKVSRSAFAASQVDWRWLQKSHKDAWVALVRRVFQQLDTDSDGVLRAGEIMARLEQALPEDQHSELQQLVAEAMQESGQPSSEQAMDFNDFIRMLKVSSVDSLDMWDDRLAATLGTAGSIDRLNAMLQRAGSLGSLHGSKHGGALLRSLAAADDSHHSGTTGGDRTMHLLFDLDASNHGDNSAQYGNAWRFQDVATPGGGHMAGALSSGARAGGSNGGGAAVWRFDADYARAPVAVPPSAPMAAPSKPAMQFRFETVPRQQAQPAVQASPFNFDVASPAVLQPQAAPRAASTDSLLGWRAFDSPAQLPQPQTVGYSAHVGRMDDNSNGSRSAGGGWFDKRHHGSALYKNSVVSGLGTSSCRVGDWSAHGAHRVLEPVQE